jgi:polyisoprenoid-binding protein YceI
MLLVNHYVCNSVIVDMKKLSVILLLFLANCAIAQVKYTITKSSVTFQIKNLGINTHGSFGLVQGNILFDPEKPETGSIETSIDANSINTDNDMRDSHLKEDSYFDVANYPKISMKSVALKHKSGSNYEGQFNLTIKGHTKQVSMPFTYTESGNSAVFKGVLKIKRTDFGVGGGSLVMSDEVLINIEVDANK